MTRAFSIALVMAALGPASMALGQPVPDHLKCYKVKSPEGRSRTRPTSMA